MTNMLPQKYDLLLSDFEITELDVSDKVLRQISENQNTQINCYFSAQRFNLFLAKTGQVLSEKAVEDYKRYLLEAEELKYSSVVVILGRIRLVAKKQAVIMNNQLMQLLIDQIFKSHTKYRPERKIARNRYLTAEEVRAMIAACRQERDKLLIIFLTKTALRITEMINVKLSDITIYNKYLYVINIFGKGSKYRDVTVEQALVERIKRNYNSKKYLFETKKGTPFGRSNLFVRLNRIAVDAGIGKRVGCHIFRHTALMLAKEHGGKSIKWLAELAGHSSTSTTANMYVHEDVTEDMNEAIEF